MNKKLMLRIPEVVEATGLGRTVIYERIAAGELTSVKVGGARLVHVDDLEEFVARLRGHDHRRVDALLKLIDEQGRIDVAKIPEGTTLTDLEAAKRVVVAGHLAPAG